MKKNLLLLFIILAVVNIAYSQAPNAIPYQGVARNAAGNILAAQPISLRVSIHDISASGTVVFSETHAVTTTALGLFNVNIGSGTAVTGTLAGVNWGSGAKYIQVEMDATGGTSYADMGTTQLNSVPYALYAGNANSGNFVDLTTNQTIAGSKTFSSAIKITAGSPGAGKVLTSDAAGLASWTTPAASSTCSYIIGQNVAALGGFIFYLDGTGCHGLVCAPTDHSTAVQWYNLSFTNTTAFGSAVGAGYGNTYQIKFNQGAGTYAASVANSYGGGGFNDWYLPSRYELNLMYSNIGQGNALGLGNVGGFAYSYYWSSTEFDDGYAWYHSFGFGYPNIYDKYSPNLVRAVRAF